MNKLVITALGVISTLFSTSAYAQTEGDFELEVEAGVIYDSNINVPEADILVDGKDMAATFGASAEYELSGDFGEVGFGYAFNQRLYEDFDQFDLQSHRFSVGGATDIQGARLGVDYSYSIVRLDNDAFLDLQLLTPSVSGFVSDQIYARGYYRYLDKNFEILDERDADNHAGGLAVFYFFQEYQAYFSVTGEYESENAVDPQFDYEGFSVSADLQLPVGIVEGAEANFGYSYRDRDYDNITQSIGERREEDRSRFEAGLEFPIVGDLALETEYQYTDRNSNFPSADYNEHLVTALLKYTF